MVPLVLMERMEIKFMTFFVEVSENLCLTQQEALKLLLKQNQDSCKNGSGNGHDNDNVSSDDNDNTVNVGIVFD